MASFPEALRQLRAEELPISIRHALTAGAFSSSHRDPFDRIRAAQALNRGPAALVTRDPIFPEFHVETIW